MDLDPRPKNSAVEQRKQTTDDRREEDKKASKTRVRVAIRVRPFIPKEIAANDQCCVDFPSTREIVLGRDRSFRFDRVFSENNQQIEVYNECIKDLVSGCFQGYNAAVLAYGQTGSGKTFTMGTASSNLASRNDLGIIPRVIGDIFSHYEQKKAKYQISIRVSFLEIYNEDIIDLLKDNKPGQTNTHISIHEKHGQVYLQGAQEITVKSAEETVYQLEKGGNHRTTSTTLMNDASSRSHAIFTVFIEQQAREESTDGSPAGCIMAKFFFVDLAGSERIKKTGASGNTLKQGININLGLLELGNVISALATVEKRENQFITYRNSKLTRILQDSLGGNSNTYMIACVSPAQSNYQESLSTLKYATKAMSIKNKPIVNTDPVSAQITQYKQRIATLQADNRKLKQTLGQRGINVQELLVSPGEDTVSSQLREAKFVNTAMSRELDSLRQQLKGARKKANQCQIQNYKLRREKDVLGLKLQNISKDHPQLTTIERQQLEATQSDVTLAVLTKYQTDLEALEGDLRQRDSTIQQLQLECEKIYESSRRDEKILISKNKAIYVLTKEKQQFKKEIEEMTMKMSLPANLHKSASISESMIQSVIVQGESMTRSVAAEQVSRQIDESTISETDMVIKEQEQQFSKQVEETQCELEQVDQHILEREQFLEKMTAEQIMLEHKLISEMKNQYHQEIGKLQKELETLKRQQTSSNTNSRDKTKIQLLENSLKQYMKKAKEQKSMEKVLQTQDSKIKDLADEIKRFKSQKLELYRKLKEDKESFQKMKQKRTKQLMQAKSENRKKDVKIRQLVVDKKRQDLAAQKKDKQFARMKQINQRLKGLSSNTKGGVTAAPTQQHIENVEAEDEWGNIIRNVAYRLITGIDQTKTRERTQAKMIQQETELMELIHEDATIRMTLDRLKAIDETELTEEEKKQFQKSQLDLQELKERVTSLEESLDYARKKYKETLPQIATRFDFDSEIGLKYQNAMALKGLLKAAIKVLQQALGDNSYLYEQYENKKSWGEGLMAETQRLREQIITMNSQHQNSLQKIREEMISARYNEPEQSQSVNVNALLSGSIRRIEERDKKILQKKVEELTKANRQALLDLDTWRRRYNVVQERYQNLKQTTTRDRNNNARFGGQKQSEEGQPGTDNTTNQDISISNVGNTSMLNSSVRGGDGANEDQNESVLGELSGPPLRWECKGTIETGVPVLSMAVFANLIISTSARSLKVWDLSTSGLISNLSGPHLAGQVKHVIVDPIRNQMLTACQRNVTVWDIINLDVVGTFKAHRDEVRTLHIHKDMLFSGGKGLANSGGLMVWDLRMLGSERTVTHPLDEKEKAQDIMTMASYFDPVTAQNTLYYGTRNHYVRRININTLETGGQLEPPHLDCVTSLAVVRNSLVSGSKDKNLKMWSLEGIQFNQPCPLKCTMPVSMDHVTALTADSSLPIFYTGSRDGSTRICGIRNDHISTLASLIQHTQSVNAICSVQQFPNNSFMSASTDKTIKLWKPTDQTLEILEKGMF